MTPEKALEKLVEGNKRFTDEKSVCLDRNKERRQELLKIQEPFAVIVGCSDSRVSPEIVFDQGIGNLFIVRDAGNVVGPIELNSIEYSVKYLHSSLIVVLGHENCGAVTAVINQTTEDIKAVASLIQPAADQTQNDKENRVEKTVKANVRLMVERIKKSPIVASLKAQGKLKVVGGYYNFHSGKVEWLIN